MLRKITVLFCAFAFIAAASPASTNQDDSCDIAVTPAATLLLPYFEVDISSAANVAKTTLFSVINTSPQPQIARVTLWTDWAFPAYSFDLFLTGYDVQSVNLRDVLVSGAIPQTSAATIPGSLSQSNNPNHLPSMASDCAKRPEAVPAFIRNQFSQIFTTGIAPGNSCTARVGGVHTNAIGYATIDVVATCSTSNPSNPSYFATELLFDNVLTGDYQYVNPSSTAGNYAGGSLLVHIRAIPEGGPAGSSVATNLPYTFYDRLTVASGAAGRAIDRRQPLPAVFAVRYLQWFGEATTRLYIWREASSGPPATCGSYVLNSNDPLAYTVRFDEHENSYIPGTGVIITPPPGHPGLPSTAGVLTSSSLFPQNSGTADSGGWLYLNMSNGGSPAYSTPRANQNWIAISMIADGRYNVVFDAAPLANGCSAAPKNDAPIGPGANVTP